MFRLVRFPGFKIVRPQMVNHHINSKFCFLCGINNLTSVHNLKQGTDKSNVVCKRLCRTSTDALSTCEIAKRRRFRKDKKFFTELLEVFSDTGTFNQTKAPVRNLKPGDVSRIATNPMMELDNFHTLKKKSKEKVKDQNSDITLKMTHVPSPMKLSQSDRTSTGKDLEISTSMVTGFSEVFSNDKKSFSTESKSKDDVTATNTEEPSELGLKEYKEETNYSLNSLLEATDKDVLPISTIDPRFQESVVDEYEYQIEDVETEVTSTEGLNILPMKNTKEKRIVVRKQKTKDQQSKEKLTKLEKMCREKSFNTTLHAYMKVCVSCNFLQRGMASLNYYVLRSRRSANNPKVTDIRTFEVIMRGYAEKGNFSKVNELWKMLISAGLQPSLNTYVSWLESAARLPKNKEHIPKIIQSLKDSGHQLNDLFVKCTFLGDQQNIVLKAIQDIEPDFVPEVPPPSICYSCSLLQEINEKQGRNTDYRSPAEGLFSKEQLHSFAEEQFNNEFSFDLKVKSVEKRIEPEEVLALNRQKLNSMRTSWMEDLKGGFHRDVKILEMVKKPNSFSLLPYMKLLDSQNYVDIMMKEIQRLAEGSETFSPSTYQLYRHLGNQVRNRYVVKFKKTHGIVDKTKLLYDKYCNWYLDPSANNHRSSNSRQEWQHLLHENHNGPSIVGDEEYWPTNVLIGVGKFLYNIIIGDVKIDVNIFNKSTKHHLLPAFYRVYRQQRVKSMEEIKPHPVLSRLYRMAAEDHILFDINLVPMLSPPLPWISYQFGGFLASKTDIIRLPDQAMQQRQRLKEAPPEQLYPSLDSLNQLGSIPWKVNKPVLDTVIEVFNSGGCGKLEIPEPSYLSPVAEPVHPDMNKEERFQAYRQRLLLRRHKAEMYSLWCDALYKLSLANHYRDRIFWLPHNMDFRGRVYPCPPHLNHLGADMSRSLLCFALGKPLGPKGLDWLKIHLVNLLGIKKKESVQQRLDYANTIMPDILDSAEKPLTGRKWWMESETPWQTLGSCKEILAALQHPEGPEHFVSHFPIHQDGSCNGLQHYAALGRDEAGACSVNLMPQELPQDVYSCVAALVERERVKDSAAGLKVAQELDGFVRRKVIKQTVMTTVYGVTRYGARLQIAKQLRDIESFPRELVWPASTYLVVKTFESLREMFNSTKEIQDWFTECARLVSQTCGENMEYVTPLGLPVVQHYSRQTKQLDLRFNKLGHFHDSFPVDMFERPNVMKQKNAFPPNFIHSLDSSHMMLTSIFSEQRGITFVSVHDCFWTHASTVHIMNQICRQQFVALHSEPILEDLSKFMIKKYVFGGSTRVDHFNNQNPSKERLQWILDRVPTKGTFLLENVLDSIYFFS